MSSPEGRVRLSVITPIFNGASILGETFDAIAAQLTDFDWEMVCADNGSTDDTVAVVRSRAAEFPSLTVVDASDQRGVGHARNVAVAASRGEVLVFIDQDDVMKPGYLAAMERALRTHDLVAAKMDGKTLNPGQVDRIIQTDGIPITFDRYPGASGGSMGLTRALFDELGGFDTNVGVSDDIDFCWRAQLLGHPIEFVPDAVLMYRFRSAPGALYRQGIRYGEALSIMTRRYSKILQPVPHAPARVVTKRQTALGLLRLDKAAIAEAASMAGWLRGKRAGRKIPVEPLSPSQFTHLP